MKAIKINKGDSYKVGMNEVIGLEAAMRETIKPVLDTIKNRLYWNESLDFEPVEYKSRDGFIPHSHNLGGLQLWTVIPKCEEYNFSFLTFGDYDSDYDYDGDSDHLDAGLRIWFKLDSVDNDTLNFYLVMAGGNGDAPYFRTKYEETYFEAEFSCKSVNGVKKAANKHIKALIKKVG